MKKGKNLIHSFNHTASCQGNFEGLTKREHFASMAMQGLLAGNPKLASEINYLTVRSVECADEILKQLEE